MQLFRDRRDAGLQLAAALERSPDHRETIVLGLPRGGVPVADEVARGLGAPLDVLVVRKLGVPGHEELAMGALAAGGARVIDREIVALAGVSEALLARVIERARLEVERRERVFRGGRPPIDVAGKRVIVVDDGLATGSTMRAAIHALQPRQPARLVVAVPVAAPATAASLRAYVDQLICLHTPPMFHAVGLWYEDFSQTTDDEVREILNRAAREQLTRAPVTASDPVTVR